MNTLARDAASRLRHSWPEHFDKHFGTPGDLRKLADALCIGVRTERHPLQPARLEVDEAGILPREEIVLSEKPSSLTARFSFAHEIGHVILLREFRPLAKTWPTGRRERFANVFARELLMPSDTRKELCQAFRDLRDPAGLLALSKAVRASPQFLFNVISSEKHWLRGFRKLWLRVKYRANEFTGLEPRLRIVGGCFDTTNFFVPTNQSVKGLVGDDNWLVNLDRVAIARTLTNVCLSQIAMRGRRRFVRARWLAELSAMRLSPATADAQAYYILLIDPKELVEQRESGVSHASRLAAIHPQA